MNFELTETQQLIQRTARDFAQKRLAPGAAERDQKAIYPEQELKRMAELGLMGINVDEKYGGVGAGAIAYALAMTEIAKVCASTAVTMAVNNMVAEIICRFGSAEQIEKHVPKIISGEYSAGAFALTEPSCGSDAANLRTTAKKTKDGWVINGTKQFITSGSYAGVIVLWARTSGPGSGGISAFLIPADCKGMTIGPEEKKMGLLASNTVSLIFEDALVPFDCLLSEEGRGFSVAMVALDGGRIGVASQANGIAQAALEAAIDYARERQSFGKTLSQHQAIQWMLADCATELDAAKLLIMRAARLKEQEKPFTLEASIAKLFSTESANRICARAFQIHGGYGYVKEYPVERYLRDCRVTTIYEGTSEIQRMVIARQILKN